MKKLYLVRHAKSSRAYPEIPDFERPLNTRGRIDAPVMGELLKSAGVKPDLMISSPANRALATARIMASHLGYILKDIAVNEDVYEAWREDLVSVIKQIPDNRSEVMLVGHNPGLQLLAEYLTGFQHDNLPTCGVVGIAVDAESWKDISPDKCRMLLYEFPKKQRE